MNFGRISVPNSSSRKRQISKIGENERGTFINVVPPSNPEKQGHLIQMAAFTNQEVYQLYMLYFKNAMTAEMHEWFSVFCDLRGMNEEKTYHDQQYIKLKEKNN